MKGIGKTLSRALLHRSATKPAAVAPGATRAVPLSTQSVTTTNVAAMARKEDFAHKASLRATVLALWLVAATLAVAAMLMQ